MFYVLFIRGKYKRLTFSFFYITW